MKREEVVKSIRAGKLIAKIDWLSNGVGLLILFLLWGTSAIVVFIPTSTVGLLQILFFILSGGAFTYGIYCLIHENDLTKVETGLSAVANRELMIAVYKELGWNSITKNNQYVVAAYIANYFSVGQDVVALIEDNNIYLNVKHRASSKGRLPFFFGSNWETVQLVRKMIKTMPLTPHKADH